MELDPQQNFCPKCGGPTASAWTLCDKCRSVKNQLAQNAIEKTVIAPTWICDLQKASKIEESQYGFFNKNADEIANAILKDAVPWINNPHETNINEQYTVINFGGTVTLDFQGCRVSGNSFWVDYQGQVGGGSTKRKSYFQVMIQCQVGLPTLPIIIQAITSSNNGGQSRSIICLNNCINRPKT